MSIRVDNLSFSYGERPVLRGVCLEAKKGELLSLLGPNGVGKSTLFRCILGLLDGYSGDAYLEGDNTRHLSARELARRIAYIPQSHYPSFNFSVFDMVLMGTTAQVGTFSTPNKKHMEAVDAVLDRLGLLPLKDRGYMQISGGERQLVLIARALVQEATVLIMDEPTSNLDYGNQLKVMEEMKKLAGEGYCILESTHHPEQAFLYADRLVCMKDGAIIADGPPQEVMNSDLVSSLYGVDVTVRSLPEGVCVCVPSWASIRQQQIPAGDSL